MLWIACSGGWSLLEEEDEQNELDRSRRGADHLRSNPIGLDLAISSSSCVLFALWSWPPTSSSRHSRLVVAAIRQPKSRHVRSRWRGASAGFPPMRPLRRSWSRDWPSASTAAEDGQCRSERSPGCHLQNLSQLEWLSRLQIPPKSDEGLNDKYLRKVSLPPVSLLYVGVEHSTIRCWLSWGSRGATNRAIGVAVTRKSTLSC